MREQNLSGSASPDPRARVGVVAPAISGPGVSSRRRRAPPEKIITSRKPVPTALEYLLTFHLQLADLFSRQSVEEEDRRAASNNWLVTQTLILGYFYCFLQLSRRVARYTLSQCSHLVTLTLTLCREGGGRGDYGEKIQIKTIHRILYRKWNLYAIHPAVDPMLLPSGNPIICHEEVLSWQHMSPT